MQTENFESKIRRIAGTFDRRPPQTTWEQIQRELPQKPDSGTGPGLLRWGLPLALVAAVAIGLIIWPQFETPQVWMDDYILALRQAKAENKPLLLLFTRTCPDCEKLDDILERSNIDELAESYIPVRLLLDDQTPMDGAPAVPQLFPKGTLELVHLPDTHGQSAWRVKGQERTLLTWGQVWEFWMEAVFFTQRPPLLVLLTPQEEPIAQYNYIEHTELSAREIGKEIDRWLALQLDLKGEHLEGKMLFTSLCASCHNRNMKDPLTGPALGGIREKWSDYPESDLYDFIRDPQQSIYDGHPLALATWNEWKPTVMTSFSDISDGSLKKLLDYIDWQYEQN
ncbi:c-type cytochrome [Flavilitoribacter nigricans]|uniref:Cytochrome c domain-containing protein n=1 Tax=Flavilitoribacter nigricans (strain ATCC 23147 / DSM 23189 / NBRC 102662 / NCIMB 1420 / SS-2) TaxID=1122177 RepID=A0A2D0N799_FLAN2|nr:c-type cytochrome [Flavilitoribacter nigricans]PHN04394.1 hypothetical protein CRP01_20505 [Flavilitoribacter nigricans DSM 23189 = NBRC 102662]